MVGSHKEPVDPDIVFQKYHPASCLWGIRSILDYHRRSTVKGILPRWKRGREKKATRCKNPETHSLEHCTDQVQEYFNADAVPLRVEKETNHDPSKIKADRRSPIIILQRTADPDSTKLHAQSPHANAPSTFSSEKSDESMTRQLHDQRLNKATSSSHQFKDSADALEISQVNKKLFLEGLHDPEIQAANQFHIQQNSIQKLKLKKSGSFPAVGFSHMMYLRPSTLEHKQKEIWSFPKVEHSSAAVQSESLASKCAEYSFLKFTDVKADTSGVDAITGEQMFPSPALSQVLNKHGRHSSVMSYITDIKKMIKHALKHSIKRNESTIIGGIFVGVSSEHKSSNQKEVTSHEDDGKNPRKYLERDGPGKDICMDGIRHVRRESSLNESLDKYTQLFDHSFSRKSPRDQFRSRGLELTTEDKNLSRVSSLKTFRRRFSMPDLDSFSTFADEVSNDDLKPQMTTRATAYNDTNVSSETQNDFEPVSINASREEAESPECEKDIAVGVDVSGNNENSSGLVKGIEESTVETVELLEQVVVTHQDEQLASTINSIEEKEDKIPVSLLETPLPDDVTWPTEFLFSQGSGLEPSSISAKESDGSADKQEGSNEDSSAGFFMDTATKETTLVDNHFHNTKLGRQDDPDFNYVKVVLDISGFLEEECLATWHSLDQPLSPELFKELEAYLPLQQIYSTEAIISYNDHQLLFDVVNEVLLEVFDRSLAYFPKQFSFTQCIRPVPKGNRVLEEVWNRISWYRNSGSKMNQDDIKARDMAKGDGWMNLQLDVEDVALDLEDTIFDELIDEAIYE